MGKQENQMMLGLRRFVEDEINTNKREGNHDDYYEDDLIMAGKLEMLEKMHKKINEILLNNGVADSITELLCEDNDLCSESSYISKEEVRQFQQDVLDPKIKEVQEKVKNGIKASRDPIWFG